MSKWIKSIIHWRVHMLACIMNRWVLKQQLSRNQVTLYLLTNISIIHHHITHHMEKTGAGLNASLSDKY